MKPFDFALNALATYRITRLITTDDITRPLREKVIRHAYGDEIRKKSNEVLGSPGAWQEFDGLTELAANDETVPNLAKLILCPHCTGVYAALAVWLGATLAPRVWKPLGTVLALSAVPSIVPMQD